MDLVCCDNLQADMRQNLGDFRSAATAYKRAIAEAPAADLGLLEVHPPGQPFLSQLSLSFI